VNPDPDPIIEHALNVVFVARNYTSYLDFRVFIRVLGLGETQARDRRADGMPCQQMAPPSPRRQITLDIRVQLGCRHRPRTHRAGSSMRLVRLKPQGPGPDRGPDRPVQ